MNRSHDDLACCDFVDDILVEGLGNSDLAAGFFSLLFSQVESLP
jgi:hypothetical protein